MSASGSVVTGFNGLLRNVIGPLEMYLSMTLSAKGDQGLLGIVSEQTSRLGLVNLKLPRVPTALAVPAVPLQYLLAWASIRVRSELNFFATPRWVTHS